MTQLSLWKELTLKSNQELDSTDYGTIIWQFSAKAQSELAFGFSGFCFSFSMDPFPQELAVSPQDLAPFCQCWCPSLNIFRAASKLYFFHKVPFCPLLLDSWLSIPPLQSGRIPTTISTVLLFPSPHSFMSSLSSIFLTAQNFLNFSPQSTAHMP